jgi:hypothetical protein
VKKQAERDANTYFRNSQLFRDLQNTCGKRGSGSPGSPVSSLKGKAKRQFLDARSEPDLREEVWRRSCETFYWNYLARDALLAGMDADHSDERFSEEDFSSDGGYDDEFLSMKFTPYSEGHYYT